MSKVFTINEIAKEANVSKATVSRVLNNPSSVKKETRDKIEEIIRERQFTPSATARNLSRKQSMVIGVIVPQIDNPFFGEILRGITEVANEKDYTIICYNSDNDIEKDFKALQMMSENRVLGVLYTPATNYSTKQEEIELNRRLEALNAPVVLLDREVKTLEYDGVFFDDEYATYEATRKFIKAGHKKIAIINATMDRVLEEIRYRGYKRALEEAGMEVKEEYVFDGEYKVEKTYEISKKMFLMMQPPTAVLTCNNYTSLGFLRALYDLPHEKRKEVSCIGLDKIEALDVIRCGFNYIERDAKHMGKTAINLLYDRLQNIEKPITKTILMPKLVINKI